MLSKLRSVLFLAALVLSACAPSGAAQNASDSMTQGRGQYVALCASCHGVDAAGSDLAPSVIGRNADAIRAQVRNPVGEMPSFTPALLSDNDLELVIQYVLSQAEVGDEEHEHEEEEIAPTEEERVHLMAAFEAIEDYGTMDREAAIAHLQQAFALSTGEKAEMYAELIEFLENNKAGNARHELEELLGMMEH